MIKIAPKYIGPGIHLLIWASVLVIPLFIFHNFPLTTGLPNYYFLVTNIYHIGLFYMNAWILYPVLFNRRTWWAYLIVVGIILSLSYYVKLTVLRGIDPGFVVTAFNNRILFFPPLPFLLASFIFRFISGRIQDEKAEKERKAQHLESTLKFLRSQISPHFLFNMMTNMVSLARQKSDLLESSLLKLSDLLRYMLYESDQDRFPISQEILYLKSYIELQQLRFGEGLDLQLEINAEGPDRYIEPMLLVPFVENAFKHGIGMVPDPYIKITLEMKDGHLLFSVINNYNRSNGSKDGRSGIGLINVKNRLNLLYPRNYNLSIQDSGSLYTVKLNLEIPC
jgi:two-component system LytT family sensor kinase